MSNKPDPQRRKELKALYRKQEEEKQAARRYLSPEEMRSLQAYVDSRLQEEPCDRSLRLTMQWADEAGGRSIDKERLRDSLAQLGAYCDCEVVLNVDYDTSW